MDDQDLDLPSGLYERLVTAALKARLDAADPGRVEIRVRPAAAEEVAQTLARHIRAVVARALSELPDHERAERQVAVTNHIIDLLADAEETIALPVSELLSIRPRTGDPALDRETVAPLVPLSAEDLLVNARGEPAHALAHEIPSADRIDLLCAFIRWHGLRVLADPLVAHCRAGRPLRVVTTVYTGSTERKALDWLVSLGAQVKVSYDTQATRLHAKAWLFRRHSGYSTAYIGSSNLSKSALLDGVEWNVRLSAVASPAVLGKFDATFDSYWNNPEYEEYRPDRDGARFDRAVASTINMSADAPPILLDVEPWPHQREILESLDAKREMRLWDALERQLLCPFQYFGLHDNSDLSTVRWSRRGYDLAALENLYTAFSNLAAGFAARRERTASPSWTSSARRTGSSGSTCATAP